MGEEILTLGKVKKKWARRRGHQMLRDHLRGVPYRELAEKYKISAGHAGNLVREMVRRHYEFGVMNEESVHRLPKDIEAKLLELAGGPPEADSV